ncbi:MAG: hypothetical protein CVU63_02175 [Deltaproteobacteria bacterium HGW-Deltaproteobacteria-20]|jgi:hypothetical protein|nr:MAG: hypothetical protein CVU63_02175 [Deltaproteobacteria bacterium HGW-Deltaproteobacteria-20]
MSEHTNDDGFPDLLPFDALVNRVNALVEAMQQCADWRSRLDSLRSTSYTCSDLETGIGRFADERWRRHVLAVLVADWACYAPAVERVDLNRLLYVAHVFPQGFRVWWCRSSDGHDLPVGYAAWYPVSAQAFEVLTRHSDELEDRFVPPLRGATPGGAAYVFNYSIIEPLRKTPASRALMQTLARELDDAGQMRLAAIAVSGDGVRIAERFGMSRVGTLDIDGSDSEYVLATV